MSSNNAVIKTWFAQPILEVFDLISEDENENLIKQIEFIKSNTQVEVRAGIQTYIIHMKNFHCIQVIFLII